MVGGEPTVAAAGGNPIAACGHDTEMTDQADDRLWGRAAAGDAHAFGELYARHDRAVTAFCLWKTGDPSAADDLKQMVFLEAWRIRARTPLTTTSARPLLLGIATNVARNQWRSKRRYRAALERLGHRAEPAFDHGADAVERLAAVERLGQVRAELNALPAREREVLVLVGLAELTYEETAAMLDLPVGTVRSRLSRARAKLEDAADVAATTTAEVSR